MTISDRSDRKIIVSVLSVLSIVIVVCIIVIVCLKFFGEQKNGPELEWDEMSEMNNLAIQECEEIKKIYNTGAITKEEADEKYQEAFLKVENNYYKVHLTTCYAKHMFYKNKDSGMAIDLIKSIEMLADDWMSQINYYATLTTIYRNSGNTEEYEFYKQKLAEIENKFSTEDAEEEVDL